MTQFRITVDGITREEYLEAGHQSNRYLYSLLAFSMILICGVILLFTKNTRPVAFLAPAAIYVAIVAALEILTRTNYKDQLAVIDPPVEYEFGAAGWTVHKGDSTVTIPWKGTPKLRKTRHCLFLYNDDITSNLLPLRSLSQGQINSIENWFKLSRSQSREYQKEQDRLARKKFQQEHPGLRLGRTGPAWGPLKRRK